MLKPKFNVGQIVRYGEAPSCIIEITEVVVVEKKPPFNQRFKYHGTHYMGRTVGVYEKEARLATISDIKMYKKERRK